MTVGLLKQTGISDGFVCCIVPAGGGYHRAIEGTVTAAPDAFSL